MLELKICAMNGPVTQSVEYRPFKARVEGSNPFWLTILIPAKYAKSLEVFY